jgi:hypothetical protein
MGVPAARTNGRSPTWHALESYWSERVYESGRHACIDVLHRVMEWRSSIAMIVALHVRA